MDLAKLCEKCNEKEGEVEDEEKDPVGPSHMEATQWDCDERQDQGQTQWSGKNPNQQAVHFKLRRNKTRQNIMFECFKTTALTGRTCEDSFGKLPAHWSVFSAFEPDIPVQHRRPCLWKAQSRMHTHILMKIWNKPAKFLSIKSNRGYWRWCLQSRRLLPFWGNPAGQG